MANYSFGINPIPSVENGHTFTGDNFTQLNPHTPILAGKTGLKFINCNLTNCDPPANSVYDGCQPKHCEFCSNLFPEFPTKYGLKVCPINCEHVNSSDTISIDGIEVDTIYYYEVRRIT